MPKGRPRKNKDEVENKRVISSDAPSKEMMDAMEASILKDYQNLFGTIPDRRGNLFKTNIPGLDFILGGGLPRGQMVHIFGPEGCGKSTLSQMVTAAIQAQGGKVLYIDAENSLDRSYASALGVQSDLTYINKIPSGEVALDIIEKSIRAGLYSLIIVDSVPALTPAEVINSSNQDVQVAVQGRMMSKALSKINNAAVNNDTIIIFVNQLRSNITPMPGARPFTTPGGKAIPFYSNTNIYVQKIGPVKDGDVQIGQQVKIRVEKNKIAAPYKDVVCNLVYGQGFRRDMDLILSAKDHGILHVAGGGWYQYKGEKLGQGLNAAVAYAKEHPAFLDELEVLLYGQPKDDAGVAEAASVEGA